MTAQNPYALQNASHTAALFRQAGFSPFGDAGGILSIGEYAVTAQSTPNMSVQVAGGRAWVPGSQVSNVTGQTFSTQAGYFALNDAPVTVTISTANPTNPRIDLIYVAVNDSFYSGTNNNTVVGVVTGTPAASPVAPSAPSNSLALATVAVAANASSVTNGNIAQTPAASVLAIARGGTDPALSTARPTTGLYPGYQIYETNTGRFYEWTGTAWQYVGGNPPPISAATAQTGWTNLAGQAPGVYKDGSGLVHLVGAVTNTNTYNPNGTNVCLQLPSGFFPQALYVGLILAFNQPVAVSISTAGVVTISNSPASSIPAGSSHWLGGLPPFHPAYAGAVPLS